MPRLDLPDAITLALLPDPLLRLAADPHVARRARAIAERVGLDAVYDRRPATPPFADLRRLELAEAIARDPKVVLVDEPFAGLTAGEVRDFSALIASFRAENKAVLLVDHNVKGVAARRGHAAAEGRPALLDLRGLSVSYGKARALDAVDLTLREGEFVSVVGLNGAGKTTLFNAVSGLAPHTGEARFAGASLARLARRDPRAAGRIG